MILSSVPTENSYEGFDIFAMSDDREECTSR